MGKIYTSISDFEEAQEKEFRLKCEEMAYYQGDRERYTIDGEWTEEELKDDIYSEAKKFLLGDKNIKGWISVNSGRAMVDPDLIKVEYLVEDICNRYDLIEVYNRAYDLHRNDKPMKFGIHYFDELVQNEIKKTLKNNLITG